MADLFPGLQPRSLQPRGAVRVVSTASLRRLNRLLWAIIAFQALNLGVGVWRLL